MIDFPLPTYKELEYEAFNSGGVEREVGELLYSFVRIQKPLDILETGTHKGISSAYMALACKENGKGLVYTIEFDSQHYQDAENLWNKMEVDKYISQFKGKVEDFKWDDRPEAQIGIILSDTEPSQRFAELVRFYPYLKPGGYYFIHDLHRHLSQLPSSNPDHPEFGWPYGALNEEIKNWLKDRDLVPFYFNNPRGLTGFYKRRSDDYHV